MISHIECIVYPVPLKQFREPSKLSHHNVTLQVTIYICMPGVKRPSYWITMKLCKVVECVNHNLYTDESSSA